MVVVSNIFYFHPYLGKISNLTNIFQRGWNHQLEVHDLEISGGTVDRRSKFWNTELGRRISQAVSGSLKLVVGDI